MTATEPPVHTFWTRARTELALVLFIPHSLWLLPLPRELAVGTLALFAAALLLFQGLLRDLWIISRSRSRSGEVRVARCLCLESTLGVAGVIFGALLLSFAASLSVNLNPVVWVVGSTTVLIVGFFVRELVVDWGPFRIRRDPDHLNVIFSWKS